MLPDDLRFAAEERRAAKSRKEKFPKLREEMHELDRAFKATTFGEPDDEFDPATLAAQAFSVYHPAEDEALGDDLPELIEDVLAKIFANLRANRLRDAAQAC